jgi:hypothetical protein
MQASAFVNALPITGSISNSIFNSFKINCIDLTLFLKIIITNSEKNHFRVRVKNFTEVRCLSLKVLLLINSLLF